MCLSELPPGDQTIDLEIRLHYIRVTYEFFLNQILTLYISPSVCMGDQKRQMTYVYIATGKCCLYV